MPRETPFEKDLRALHGDEVIEMEAGSPTGRTYKVVRRDPLAGWPVTARVTLVLVSVVAAVAIGLLGIFGVTEGVYLLGSIQGWWGH